MGDQRQIRRAQLRRAKLAILQSSLMYACVLEGFSWGGDGVGVPQIFDELKFELDECRKSARELRQQARSIERAAARLDLPEQIW